MSKFLRICIILILLAVAFYVLRPIIVQNAGSLIDKVPIFRVFGDWGGIQ